MSKIYLSALTAALKRIQPPAWESGEHLAGFNAAKAMIENEIREKGWFKEPDTKRPMPNPVSDHEREDNEKFERVIASFEGMAEAAREQANSLAAIETMLARSGKFG